MKNGELIYPFESYVGFCNWKKKKNWKIEGLLENNNKNLVIISGIQCA